jgi:hypothetical protein
MSIQIEFAKLFEKVIELESKSERVDSLLVENSQLKEQILALHLENSQLKGTIFGGFTQPFPTQKFCYIEQIKLNVSFNQKYMWDQDTRNKMTNMLNYSRKVKEFALFHQTEEVWVVIPIHYDDSNNLNGKQHFNIKFATGSKEDPLYHAYIGPTDKYPFIGIHSLTQKW